MTIDQLQAEWWKLQNILDQGGLTALQVADIQKQQANLHQQAEAQRQQFGFSGGPAGDQVIVLPDDPNTPFNEEERFRQTFSDQDLTGEGYKDIIKQIESGASALFSGIGVDLGIGESGQAGSGLADLAITAVIGLFLFRIIKGVFN